MPINGSQTKMTTIMDESLDCQIAIAMHKSYTTPKDRLYLPIHVGAAQHPTILPDLTQDNFGDNISTLNPYYSELTALYWIWKNSNAPYKGLVHYRRYFASSNLYKRLLERDPFNKVATKSEIQQILNDVDIILPKRRNYFIETTYSHYIHTHTHSEIQLAITRNILEKKHPEYIAAFDQVMHEKHAHMFNMLVMSSSKLDEYCSWLFPILSELTTLLDPSEYEPFSARYPGRVSELLLDVWLITHKYPFKELPLINIEPTNWMKKGTSFILAKYTNKKYSASF